MLTGTALVPSAGDLATSSSRRGQKQGWGRGDCCGRGVREVVPSRKQWAMGIRRITAGSWDFS